MEILDKYIAELEEDLKLDRVQLEEKSMMVPGIKGKWLSKMIRHKRELKNHEVLFEEAKNKLVKELEKNSDIAYSKPTMERIVSDHELIKKIKKSMDTERLAIEFCERALTIVSSMSFDVKNILEGYKLELT